MNNMIFVNNIKALKILKLAPRELINIIENQPFNVFNISGSFSILVHK